MHDDDSNVAAAFGIDPNYGSTAGLAQSRYGEDVRRGENPYLARLQTQAQSRAEVRFSPKVRALNVVLSAIEGGLSPKEIRAACDALEAHLEV